MRKFACCTAALKILSILVLTTAIRSRALDIVWTNTAGGNWSTAANWSPNQAPAANDTARITNAGTFTITLSTSATVSAMNIGASGVAGVKTLQITTGTLTVTNGTAAANGIISLAGGTLITAGPFNSAGAIHQTAGTWQLLAAASLNVYNFTNGELRGGTLTVTNCNWVGGNMYADVVGDKTIIPAGGVFNLIGDATRYLSYYAGGQGRYLDNHGTWNWTGNSILYSYPGVVNNFGAVNVTGTGTPTSYSQFTYVSGAYPTWNNFGTFTKSGGTNIFYFGACNLNNAGTINFQSGTLSLYGSVVTNTGAINLGADAILQNDVNTTLTLAGTSSLTSPATNAIRVNTGTVFVQTTNIVAPTVWINGGTWFQQTNNTVPVINQSGSGSSWRLTVMTTVGTYNLTNGELRGGTLTITNFNWIGGNLYADVPGDKTIIPPNGVLNLPGDNSRVLSYYAGGEGRYLDNYGTWNWTGNSILYSYPGVVNNYGQVNITGTGAPSTYAQFSYVNPAALPTWNNFGTIIKSVGTNIFYFGACRLNNTGLIDLQSGTLNLYNSIVSNGGPIKVNGTLVSDASTATNFSSITLTAGSLFQTDNGGSFTLAPDSTFTNTVVDRIKLNSGTLFVQSTRFVTPSVWINGGTLFHLTNNTVPLINESAGTWRMIGNQAVDTYNLTNGELRGGTLTVTNLNWINGNLYADAPGDKTIIPAGGILNFPGTATRYFSYYAGGFGRDLDNHGTWNWTGNSILFAYPCTVNNYGNVNITGTGAPGSYSQFSFVNPAALPVWNNFGTITKSVGPNIFYFGACRLNNAGLIDFQSGQLSLYSSTVTNLGGGAITLAPSAEMVNDASTTTLLPGSMVNAASPNAFRIASGSVYVRSTSLALPSIWLAGGTLFQETNNVTQLNQSGGTWQLNVPATATTYNLTNGELRGANLTVNNFNWLGGNLNADGPGNNLVTVADTLNISGNTAKVMSYYVQPGRSLINNGTATWSGVGISGQGGATFHNNNSLTVTGDVAFAWGGSGAVSVFRNTGTYTKSSGAGNANFGSTIITNSGTFAFNSGTISLGSFFQTTGTTFLNTNFNVSGNAIIEGGTFTGRGNIAGLLYNNGTLNPGTSPGLITSATFSNAPAGTLNIELNGTNIPGTSYDQLRMTGAAALNGTMNVTLADNFAPQLSNSFVVLTHGSRSGTFSTIISPPGIALQADYTNTSLILTVVGLTNVPLQIAVFPSNQTVYTGDPATFFVGVSGTTPISYQWQFNSNNIAGATNSSHGFPAVANTNAGLYTVLITDGVGATTNASATLTVIPYDGTIYWTNTAGGNWNVAANWLPNRVPGATNHAVITNAGAYTVVINSPATTGRLTLGLASTNGQPRLNVSHDFTLEGMGVVGTNGVIDFVYNLYGAGSLSNNGTFYWGGGTMAGTGVFINGTNGSVETYANSYKYLNRRVNNFGSFSVADGYGVHGGNGGLFTNEIGGRITIAAGQTGFSVQSGATNVALYNHGLITSSGSPSVIYMPFFNEPDGTLLVNSSCYVGSGTNRGTINIPHPLASVSFVSPTFAFNSGTMLQGYGTIGVGFSGILNINAPIVCSNAFGISAGQLYNPALNLNANLTTYGTVTVGTGDLNINPGATLDAQTLTLSWFYQTYTHAYITSAGNVIANNLNLSYGTFFNSGPINVRSGLNFTGATLEHSGNGRLITQTNSSTTIGQASVSVFPYLGGGVWDNYGTVGWTFGGVLNVYNGAGIINHSNATMNLSGNGIFVNHGGTNWLVNRGLIQRNGFASTPSLDLITTNYNTVLLNNTAMWLGRFVQFSGKTDIGASFINGAKFDIRGGELVGAANVQSGATIYNAANLRPGSEIGVLNVDGPFTNTATGTYHMQIGGNSNGQYDRINVGNTAYLGGTLNLVLTNFFPTIGNTYTAMTYTARSGQFNNVVSPNYQFEVIYTPTELLLLASNALPVINLTVAPTQLICNPFLILASATDPDGSVANLSLLMNGNVIASSAGGNVSTTLELDFPQTVTFTARATDNRGGTNSAIQQVEVITDPIHYLTLGGFRSNRVFKICMLGNISSNYMTLMNTNLRTTNWFQIGSMQLSNGIFYYFDANTTNVQRYYRALQQ